MFRRDTPSTPPRAAPPALPPGEMTRTRATPIPTRDRSATPRPRTPEGASPNERPDTPRYPTWTLIPRASNSPPFLSYATVDGGESGSSSPPSPIDWDRMRMEWDEEVRAENTAAAAAAAAANTNGYEYSDGDDDDYSDDDLISPHATLTARLAALIALPSPPSYAELDRRMSQIRALSATLTFLNAPTPTTTTTTGIIPSSTTTATTDTNTNTNTNTTPLDTLILSEYRAHLAREAATTATSTAAAHGAAVQRAVAELTAEVRGALQQAGLANNEAFFNSIITAAQATIIGMLPGGRLWAADVVRWVPAEPRVRPAAAREQTWQMERNERNRDRGDVQLDYGGRLPAGTMGVVGRGGGGRRGEVLTRAELPRGARVPRSAGVSGRVWPDARTMTAAEIAEYNREAVRQDREEEASWQRQREEERRREVEAERLREEVERMEEEEEERLREVREIAARRLIAAVEEGMRGG